MFSESYRRFSQTCVIHMTPNPSPSDLPGFKLIFGRSKRNQDPISASLWSPKAYLSYKSDLTSIYAVYHEFLLFFCDKHILAVTLRRMSAVIGSASFVTNFPANY